jgi:hypothetical protein
MDVYGVDESAQIRIPIINYHLWTKVVMICRRVGIIVLSFISVPAAAVSSDGLHKWRCQTSFWLSIRNDLQSIRP